MERSEPTLVPEWLKNSGSLPCTTLHLDDNAGSKLARNKSSVNSNSNDLVQSLGSDRTTSSHFCRSSSSNGSTHLRSYISLSRNHQDRDWDDSRDKEKSVFGDHRHQDFSDPLAKNILSTSFERDGDGLRCSQSMFSGKCGENWPKKMLIDSSNASGNNSNGLVIKGSPIASVNKAVLERDFPSLGAEERSAAPDIGRVPSPGLSTAIQNLPVGTSAMIGGEKWTSALAQVPVLAASNGIGDSSAKQTLPSSSATVALSTTTGLNMAEAVAQGPTRTQTTTHVSAGTQRLEELAIKQSKQLIPVMPSLTKASIGIFSSSLVPPQSTFLTCRVRMKMEGSALYFIPVPVSRRVDTGMPAGMQGATSPEKLKIKVGHQQHPPVTNSSRGAAVKSDVSKISSMGKLQVLKPVRERNGVSPTVKEKLSPTGGSKAANSSLSVAPLVSESAAVRPLSNNPVLPTVEGKPVLPVLEKRPTSQARSRNDFFNLMRKKSMENSLPVSDLGTLVSSSVSDKLSETQVSSAFTTAQARDEQSPLSLSGGHLSGEGGDLTCNGGDAIERQKCHCNGSLDPLFSEEEEAAFLRSMGWEENAEEGGLTEEEISAFYRDVQKYMSSKPSLKILQPKILLPFNSQGIGVNSSRLSSSNAKLES